MSDQLHLPLIIDLQNRSLKMAGANIVFRVKGLNQMNRLMVNLPPSIKRHIEMAGEEFTRDVQRRAKLMAPRWSGRLKDSITVKIPKRGVNSKKIVLSVESPYGVFQELGFTPHFVPFWRTTRAGATVGDWMKSKGINNWGVYVSHNKPFMKPALERGLGALPTLIERHMQKALAGAKK